ncbi:hypothetical protein [Granulicella mallensis]|uniref:Uncharacterized protein n=1 Tax=Granulicella mallensis (strain ATCC BAA-1857 / DSM 23137 / MP5ACTX8) TaxID=682795 RepID=G8NXI5_GRAMM|nr:hypothetical protein [Granulicella mallensis]AEU38980.1 hypothetical protein AciX8_4711 [Granulicella mallensis MP5ACTX8]
MTLIRKWALKVSSAVVRYASPGCKEWAEGLAREVDFIEGDWAALSWAIGSTRVLLDRRQGSAGAKVPFKIPGAGEWIFWLMCFSQLFSNCCVAIRSTYEPERIGSALIASGWLYWGASSVLAWFQERRSPPRYEVEATLLFSRAKLERRLKRFRSVRRWFPVLATIAICSGLVLNIEGAFAGLHHVFSGVVIAGGLFAIRLECLDSPSKIEHRISLINRLIAQKRAEVND